MNFIDCFLESTSSFETPSSYWRWAAYATIAAVLRDNVFYDHGGGKKTYPNIYVLYLSKSAENRKGGPFDFVCDLLKSDEISNTKVIIGRSSIQAILEDLSQNFGIKKSGIQIKDGSCILLAEELASFFVIDPALIPLITDIWNYREEFPYTLKSNRIVIKKLCVTFLAASNEDLLKEVYTKAAVFGGLLGRTMIITPNEVRSSNSLLDRTKNKYKRGDLLKCLIELKKLAGTMTAVPEAIELYDSWYDKLYKSYKNLNDRTGFSQRMHVNVLKIAMCLAANDRVMLISKHHMEEAIIQVTSLKSNYSMFMMGSGRSAQAEIGGIFINTLWGTLDKKISRRDILIKHWNDFSSEELDKLIQTFEEAGLIRVISAGNLVTYEMTEKCKEIFLKNV